ncbi:hypothetical protein GCM10023231_23300 [Olivibacter ginsenosidimutans]|uniref:histidine kinase n=1 Tax=Olivibacter ginsenosidimutans TaxID=1176537 RepID=A0ABP9BHJ3_9SPHI
MSKQHRYLLMLITLASLVTIVFQCFWLMGNYQHEKENFIAYAERLLFESMQEEREAQFRNVYPDLYSDLVKKGNFQDAIQVFYRGPNGLGQEKAAPNDSSHVQLFPAAFMHLDFQMLQKRYREKLGPDLQDVFFLDTLHISRERFAKTVSNPTKTDKTKAVKPFRLRLLGRPIFNGPTHEEFEDGALPPPLRMRHFDAALGKTNQAIIAKFPIQATTMMLDPAKDLFLSLYLKAPSWWIFRHLAGALLSSLLLTGLTIGCLVYLLYTIFKQKKLADIKNDFVNNMTHELKTPLATVLAATETLQQFKLDDKQQKASLYLQMTHRAATHLTNLIDQILHLAVGEKKGMYLQIESVDTDKLLQQLIDTHQLIHQQQISLSIVNDIPPIPLDKMHIGNAINNLLDNAVKYAVDAVHIQLVSKIVNQHWVLSISDNGIGIASADISHIFQPFYRVPTGNIHRVKGFGLGLYYVKQVITQHKGLIEVSSTPGKGTTFTIYLPLSI